MRFVKAAAILSLTLLSSASPHRVEYNTTNLLAARGNTTNLSAGEQFIIHGFADSQCNGMPTFSYKFGVGGCRSCEPFDNSHSILIQDCPDDAWFVASDSGCSAWKSAYTKEYDISPGLCININTGYNFMSGWPCTP